MLKRKIQILSDVIIFNIKKVTKCNVVYSRLDLRTKEGHEWKLVQPK